MLAAVGALALAVASAPSTAAAAPAAAARCPRVADAADLSSVAQLRRWNAAMARFGQRPTGSRNHIRFVNWLERELDGIPGVRTRSIWHHINRWEARSASLGVDLGAGEHDIPPAAPVPYSKATPPSGVVAPLVFVPLDTPITAANAAGKIVVRDLPGGELPNAAFELVTWSLFDPGQTLDPNGVYKRDWVTGQPNRDLEAAAQANAAGLLFVHEFPRAEVRGHYRPYNGIHWKVPALHLGVDEGEQIKRAVAAGTARTGRVVLRARTQRRSPTRTLVGRLDGPGRRRVVVQTHTDGVNALWDNGHVPILAIARYFARLPRACRPGPMEFVMNTGHLYLSLEAGAAHYAEQLDRAYDRGRVALALSLEHLGAREYAAVPRGGGRPGFTLRRTGLVEPSTTFVTESGFLVDTLTRIVRRHRVERSLLLKGTSLPDHSHVPPYCSFGGEGTAYLRHLIPTVAFVTGPWTLFNPTFGLEQLDFRLLRRQTIVFTDFLLRVRGASQRRIAGKYSRYREERRQGKPTCDA
jgi:hypothetical protein